MSKENKVDLVLSAEEALEKWNEFEADLVIDRYAVRDPKTGKAQEFSYLDVKKRIVKKFKNTAIVNAIRANELITATPFLMFGNNPYSNRKGYFSCFPLGDVTDSTNSIFEMERNLVTIFQHAGGGGIDVSNLRPAGSMVDNGQGVASGPVSFAKGFAQLSTRISQGGKRRGALMIQLNYTHQDRDEFISFKSESNGQYAGCNVSLNITDDKFWENHELIDNIAEQMWKCGDPGLLFTQKSLSNTPVSSKYNPVFSNPCVAGDTLIAVADKRRSVTIKELSDIGKDVEVYCRDNTGRTAIRTMRHPRKTGTNSDLLEVILDKGHSLKVTPNHKFILRNGEIKEANDLKIGDRLSVMSRRNAEGYIKLSANGYSTSEHQLVIEKNEEVRVKKGNVIHHKDRDRGNNDFDNLEQMSKEEHCNLHMLGDENPMRRASNEWSDAKWQTYRDKMSKATSGNKNGRYIDVPNECVLTGGIDLCAHLKRPFTVDEWNNFAKEFSLITKCQFSKFRKSILGTYTKFRKNSALKAEISEEVSSLMNNSLLSYKAALESGYKTSVIKGKVHVIKKCENCKKNFTETYFRRELSFCSRECYVTSDYYLNNIKPNIQKGHTSRIITMQDAHNENNKNLALAQMDVYTDLEKFLGREPKKREWQDKCKDIKLSFEMCRATSPFQLYSELQIACIANNHVVTNVTKCASENVYNGTVDEFHNFYCAGYDENYIDNITNKWCLTLQCGEYLSVKNTACNLLTINHIAILQRLKTDDVFEFLMEVMLLAETTCIAGNEILDMSDGHPPIDEIRETTLKFRPVGIGMTGLHYAMNHFDISYGDKEKAPKFTKLVQFAIMLGSMKGSITYGTENPKTKIVPWDSNYCLKLQDRAEKLFMDNPNHSTMNTFRELFDDVMSFIQVKGGLFNSVTTSQAPTGSTSQMIHVGCTGIEPYFDMVQNRKYVDTSKHDGSFKEVTLVPLEFYGYSEEKLKWVSEQTAHKITPNQQIRILSAIQEFCHTAASKTINLPEETTVDQIKNILFKVRDSNLKGITMFRDSSIEGILSNDDHKDAPEFSELYRRDGTTVKFKGANGDNLYITANKGSRNHIREIFMNTNWAGSEGYAVNAALGRVISLALQKDYTLLDDIVQTLESVSADSQWTCPTLKGMNEGARLGSIPQAIAATLQVLHEAKDLELTSTYSLCPSCKEKACRRNGGCSTCVSCGYSSC